MSPKRCFLLVTGLSFGVILTLSLFWVAATGFGRIEGVYEVDTDNSAKRRVVVVNSDGSLAVYSDDTSGGLKIVGWPFAGDRKDQTIVEIALGVGKWESGLWQLVGRNLTLEARFWHPESGVDPRAKVVRLQRMVDPFVTRDLLEHAHKAWKRQRAGVP